MLFWIALIIPWEWHDGRFPSGQAFTAVDQRVQVIKMKQLLGIERNS